MNIRRTSTIFTVSVVSLSVSSRAFASTVSVKFCAMYGVDFTDAISGLGDDYITSTTSIPARGTKLWVRRNSDSVLVFNDYTSDTDTDPGCATVSLDSTLAYSVKVLSEARVQTNTLTVMHSDTDPVVTVYEPYAHLTPVAGTYTVTTPLSPDWDIAAATSWAMYRRAGGVGSKTFDIYSQACNGGGSCCDSGSLYADPGDGSGMKKYVIAHELGHCLLYKANENHSSGGSYALNQQPCDGVADPTGHEMNSKEWQNSAMNEGFAHYYAAVAFNNSTESDCKFRNYKNVDWDRDDAGDATYNTDCESGMSSFSVDGADYTGDYCVGSGSTTNVSTEYDYLRFFWDLDTDEALNTTDIVQILDAANPDTFTDATTGSGSGFAAYELRQSANTLGWLTEWDNWDNYSGINR